MEIGFNSHPSVLVALATGFWYFSSSINAVASQKLFQGLKSSPSLQQGLNELNNAAATGEEATGFISMAMILTVSQIGIGGIVSLAFLFFFGGPKTATGLMHGGSAPQSKFKNLDLLIGFLHCIGCICTNIGYGYGSASLVQLIKLLEPIETLLLTALVQRSLQDLSFQKATSTTAIIGGTYMLLSNPSIEINPISVLFAIGSGICMSLRNVFSKKRQQKPAQEVATTFRESLVQGMTKFATVTITSACFAVLISLIMALHSFPLFKLLITELMHISPKILNQTIIFHCLYNIASITVLSLTSATLHSLLNVGKRIANVMIASMVFNVPLTLSGKFGLAVAVIGACLYNNKILDALYSLVKDRFSGKVSMTSAIVRCRGATKARGAQSTLTPRGNARRVGVARGGGVAQTKYMVKSKLFAVLVVFFLIFWKVLQAMVSTENIRDHWEELVPKAADVPNTADVLVSTSFTRSRKVVLLGPHDRYNFGDLLFSMVITKLLVSRAGYLPNEILLGGLVSVDMSEYGGHPRVQSMKEIQNMSRSEDLPYDIIFTGGEALGCNSRCGMRMMPTEELRQEANRESINGCAYLFPKRLLLSNTRHNNHTNYAVVNSLGGFTVTGPCQEAVDTADYAAYRDHNPLYPDSAVMTKELFSDEIQKAAKEALEDLGLADDEVFVAVQHKHSMIDTPLHKKELALALDGVARGMNATVVFFAAGTVPGHDSFKSYQMVASLMKEVAIVYSAENVWKVVGLVSRAKAVFSTSLHVRIMAFVYFKPRVTWCGDNSKHSRFISLWDTNTSAPCLKVKSKSWGILEKRYLLNPDQARESTAAKYEQLVDKYLESFSNYSGMLRPRIEH